MYSIMKFGLSSAYFSRACFSKGTEVGPQFPLEITFPKVSNFLPSVRSLFTTEKVSRYNQIMDGQAYLSVSKKGNESSKALTFVRLWGKDEGAASDKLSFCGADVSVCQSPDASRIAVASDNLIGIYDVCFKAGKPYFKWNCSYQMPEDCSPCKVTFHVGSSAISVTSVKGDVDWAEIRPGTISELNPIYSDRVRVAKK